MASLNEGARQKVMLKENEYTINGIRLGPCLLKVVIGQSYLDTNATSKFIRDKLSNLKEYMSKADSDIANNTHVEDLIDSLAARGEESQDVLANLFKAYHVCTDDKLRSCMELKESAYEEGTPFTPEGLMQLAKNKFDLVKQNDELMAPSEDQKKIVASSPGTVH